MVDKQKYYSHDKTLWLWENNTIPETDVKKEKANKC